MSDKRANISDLIIKKTTVNFDYTPIPLGKKWTLVDMTVSDVNIGGNESSTYEILFGPLPAGPFISIRFLAVTGTTYTHNINEELTGDGIQAIRIARTNNSNTDKRLPFYLTMYER